MLGIHPVYYQDFRAFVFVVPTQQKSLNWLRNVEGSPFGGFGDEAVDDALAFYRSGDGTASFDPSAEYDATSSVDLGEEESFGVVEEVDGQEGAV